MQQIPRLKDVYKISQERADKKHAELLSEVQQGPYALQADIRMLPPTSELVARARWHQINGQDSIYPGDVPSQEQQEIKDLEAKLAAEQAKLAALNAQK